MKKYNFAILVVFVFLLKFHAQICFAITFSEDCYGLNPANFDHDCYVDFKDFEQFAEQWLFCGDTITDLTGDGCTNAQDLISFAEEWLQYERTNYIARFVDTNTITNSIMYDDADNVCPIRNKAFARHLF